MTSTLPLPIGFDTEITLLAAGLIFLTALALGVVKYAQMRISAESVAHPYIDTAHRAALLYAFATALVAIFVELSAWSAAVNLLCAGALVVFFVAAIASYVYHGLARDTENQFAAPSPHLHAFMVVHVAAEMVGFGVLLAGFIRAQLC